MLRLFPKWSWFEFATCLFDFSFGLHFYSSISTIKLQKYNFSRMSKTKESFKDRMALLLAFILEFLQQRLPALRLTWSPRGLVLIFSAFGILFLLLSIPLFIMASTVGNRWIIVKLMIRRMRMLLFTMDMIMSTAHAILQRITKNVFARLLFHFFL